MHFTRKYSETYFASSKRAIIPEANAVAPDDLPNLELQPRKSQVRCFQRKK